jgi:hypothetical protein
MTTISPICENVKNGNLRTSLYSDGTRNISYSGERMCPEYPVSLDVKITNWCDNPYCAAFCHEKSNKNGREGDLSEGVRLLSELPEGSEIAIGGGATQSHPDLELFIRELKSYRLVPNLTINQFHLRKALFHKLSSFTKDRLIGGVGVSINPNEHNEWLKPLTESNHVVLHAIAGIHSVDEVKKLSEELPAAKILVLGYKYYGNGLNYAKIKGSQIHGKLLDWSRRVNMFFGGSVISFDNLALEQLEVKRFFAPERWDELYQGDDGTISMYLDLVEKKAAMTSRSPEKVGTEGRSLKELFDAVKGRV